MKMTSTQKTMQTLRELATWRAQVKERILKSTPMEKRKIGF